jgi:xanthine dehydrogenase accessory factor
MMELRHILEHIAANRHDDAILATLVDVKGSGYRLAGARMLIDADGRSIGTVSGGCLEADILERAKEVRKSGMPAVVSYDTTKDDRSVFGLGMGCRGVVRVLLESTKDNDALDFIRTCFERREKGSITTLISKTSDVDLALASRIFSTGSYRRSFSQLNGLSSSVNRDAIAAVLENRSRSVRYRDTSGSLEFFHEVINPPTAMMIFGAGHDAVPLARLGANLGWKTSVIDHRPAYAVAERFPDADEIIVSRPESIPDPVFADVNSVAVVMNHNFEADLAILRRLLGSTFRYIGVLGPKDRTMKLLDELRVSDNDLADLYAPVGLDIGASTPEGIALSIVAEIQAVLAGRNGGFLKDRTAPIYDR